MGKLFNRWSVLILVVFAVIAIFKAVHDNGVAVLFVVVICMIYIVTFFADIMLHIMRG